MNDSSTIDVEAVEIGTVSNAEVYMESANIFYRGMKSFFVSMCVMLVCIMMYVSHGYKYVFVATSTLMPFKIALGAVLIGLVILWFFHRRAGHTTKETIKFVWKE